MLKRFTSLVAIAAAFAMGACDDDDDATGIDEIATVRIINAASATQSLDVRLEDELLVGNIAFGSSSACQEVPAGSQDFVFRSSGSTTDLGTFNADLTQNTSYTLVFNGGTAVDLLTDDAPAPAAGQASIRFFNATGGAIDVHATAPGSNAFGATPTAANIAADASSAFVTFPLTNNRIRVTAAGSTANVLLDIPALNIPTGGIANVILTENAAGDVQFVLAEPC
ncbi:MAG TPA: DUF4397 domain-containing protein [Gemmatimonadaceae bacterium]|nr:DUF4397 domain-containing protein [Gemmatimonadaceae bacterium]